MFVEIESSPAGSAGAAAAFVRAAIWISSSGDGIISTQPGKRLVGNRPSIIGGQPAEKLGRFVDINSGSRRTAGLAITRRVLSPFKFYGSTIH